MIWLLMVTILLILWWMYPSIKGKFTFCAQNVNREVAVNLERGDKVQFWQKPGGGMYIYKVGTAAGRGMIGKVPYYYSRRISYDMQQVEVNTYIRGNVLGTSSSSVRIQYPVHDIDDLKQREQRLQTEKESLQQILDKPYNPRKTDFTTRAHLDRKTVDIGDRLWFVFEDQSYYTEDRSIELDLVEESGRKVGYKYNDPKTLVRILRSHFSGYEVQVYVDDKPGEPTSRQRFENEEEEVAVDQCTIQVKFKQENDESE